MPSLRRLTFLTFFFALLCALANSAPLSGNDTDVALPEDIDPPTVGDPGPSVDDTADGTVKVIDDEDGEEVDLPALPDVALTDDTGKDRKATEQKVNATVVDVMVRVGLNATEIDEDKDEIFVELSETLNEFLDDDSADKRDLSSFDHVHNEAAALDERDLEARVSRKERRRRRRCRILAGILRPFVRLAARRFEKKNSGSGLKPLHEHMFFLYPLHRPLFDANVDARLWFRANWVVARFWTSTAGVTFGRRIYIRGSQAKYDPKSTAAQKNAFFTQAHLIAHEFQHVQQYRSHGWSIKKFAFEYLYRWCRAGKSYSKNPMEIAADTAANKLSNLLWTERRFFEKWFAHRLRPQLGYPVQTTYRDCGKNLQCLKFQKGEMELNTKTSCYRKKVGGSWTGPKC